MEHGREEHMGELFTLEAVTAQLEWLLRILIAGICGGLIGYERETRKKTAGLRTHVIVAVSSALMIIISKYGFYDVLDGYVRLDPSRVAAGTVTAIGFLGSGIIFTRNRNVSGLTTSAGIWATLGVGMAVGTGLYLIGIVTTVIVIVVEIFLGRQGKLAYLIKEVYQIEVDYIDSKERGETLAEKIKKELEGNYGCRIQSFQIRRKEGEMRLKLLVRTKKGRELAHLAKLAEEYPEIKRISI